MAVKESSVGAPITLKCGLTLPNRLVKAAMAEGAAGAHYMPSDALVSAYGPWADGGWGMVLTGNVQVDARYLGQPGDVAHNDRVSHEKQLAVWKRWAEVAGRNGTCAIVQINHPGRQSPPFSGSRPLWAKNMSSSPVPISIGKGFLPWALGQLLFGTPKEMTLEDIRNVVNSFVATAKLAAEAGFAGVELHGAHGYLIDQFLSETVNHRTDEYGGSPFNRARIVVDMLKAIRPVVPPTFCVGIKVNSVDHQSTERLRDCVEVLKVITDAGVDFIEVSGGTFENPLFFGAKATEEKVSDRTKAREAFFLEFASTIRHEFPDTPLIVTGGFRTRAGMQAAVDGGDCELIGLGRPAVVDPALPRKILNAELGDEEARVQTPQIKPSRAADIFGLKSLMSVVGTGTQSAWYAKKIREMGKL